MDDLEIARLLREDRRQSQPDRAGPRHAPFLGRVLTSSAAAGKFMKVVPRALVGSEAEGSAASATDLGAVPTLVYLVSGSPASGDEVLCQFVDFRWVTRRRGGTGRVVTFRVLGCDSTTLTGSSISATQGGTTVTGIDAVTVPATGTWSYTVTPAAGYAPKSGTFTITGTTLLVTVNVVPAAPYFCDYCGHTVTSLAVTWSFGTTTYNHTFTWNGVAVATPWVRYAVNIWVRLLWPDRPPGGSPVLVFQAGSATGGGMPGAWPDVISCQGDTDAGGGSCSPYQWTFPAGSIATCGGSYDYGGAVVTY